ncbi:RNA 2',3'-cyclic phosphodiesterase [Cohnella sp. JJ-181]|uniref:RNA 2',3'-cyclic phosphodiesterase n=1 Tax=Cohnella rhizoplanae TaxID=2974897 RepID=UPI00232BC5FC|nr:RNA 2',3'-cyclic phosphodiesterase [Cohnella sp. JJ-181]
MENLRLFLGIALPENVERFLGGRADWMKPKLSFRKWAHPADYHITLHYLGNIPQDRVPDIEQAIQDTADIAAPPHLSLAAPGMFGPESSPRVLWCGIQELSSAAPVAGSPAASPLHALHGTLGEHLQARIGYRPESRTYHPHITLARDCAGGHCAKRTVKELWDTASGTDGQQPGPWRCRDITLFRSHLGRSPSYERMASIPLRNME